jgi:glycosyltransferase involved in cell wall biosynthesis
MACKTPVLVSRIPNYDSHYIEEEKTVMMVEPNDPEAVATALIILLQDRARAQALASEAERRVRLSGSYESQMAKMNELYDKVFRAK